MTVSDPEFEYGDYLASHQKGGEYLELSFSPSSRPLADRWRNNGLSADFLADYFGAFIPKELPESHHNQIKGAVAYIANELLENAMKFTSEGTGQGISLSLDLGDTALCFSLENAVSQAQVEAMQAFLEEFTSMDASEYFVVQMERNVENGTESGLGFATMVTDHEATLGWRLVVDGECRILKTQVRVAI